MGVLKDGLLWLFDWLYISAGITVFVLLILGQVLTALSLWKKLHVFESVFLSIMVILFAYCEHLYGPVYVCLPL